MFHSPQRATDMPFLGAGAPGQNRSSSATLVQPFFNLTLGAGISTPVAALVVANTFQQSLCIVQTVLGGGLITVEVMLQFGPDNIVVDSFIVGAINVAERRTYRQACHEMQLRFTAPGAGAQVIRGSIGGMG